MQRSASGELTWAELLYKACSSLKQKLSRLSQGSSAVLGLELRIFDPPMFFCLLGSLLLLFEKIKRALIT